MGAINNAFNKAGWSILALAEATSKYRSKINEEKKNKAKQSYTTAATIKKQNNELTKNQEETPKSYFGDLVTISEIDEQKITEQNVLKEMAQEKAKATSFGELAGVEEAPAPEQAKATSFDELPTVSAEHSETNIDAKDPEVQGLIEVKQKNALRAAASKRGQEGYQNIKERLTYKFADEHYIEDVWRNISLEPDITDEMIRKAGYTKTKILEEWKLYTDKPSEWYDRINILGDEYGIGGAASYDEDAANFGHILSAYIRAKVKGNTLAQQQEEYDLSKAGEEPEEKNKQPSIDDWYTNFGITDNKMSNSDTYKVWQDDSQDDSTEEEKDETKKDKGIYF